MTLWLMLPLLLLGMAGCGGGAENQEQSGPEMAETEQAGMAEEPQTKAAAVPVAICLWEKVGLRAAPGTGSDAKYLTTIYFGEKVELLGESQEVDGKTYQKVRLSDGKEGWVYEYLFAIGAELGVAANETEIYRRPDLMTATDKTLERGEIVAILPSDKPGWVQVVGKERKKEGWVQAGANLTTEELDVAVVVMLDKALAETDPEKQAEALEKLSENSSFQNSVFIDLIQSELEALKERNEIGEDQLYITADKVNVRNLPSVDDSEVLFQVEAGTICNIIDQTDERIKINDMEDYWYKISCDGKEGWVFGHHTSKKGVGKDL